MKSKRPHVEPIPSARRFALVGRIALMSALLCSCSDEEPGASAAAADGGLKTCVPGELVTDEGGCLAAGMQENGCAAGEVLVEGGGCRPAGIPPEMCAAGFAPDGEDGCYPILPAAACPEGQMALPGETRCREVAPCGEGKWGDIPVDAQTEHVDGSYLGGGSDGSSAKPWTAIQDGVTAAAAGAIVAIASGTYSETVDIAGKPVRLWGRCPQMVAIAGEVATLGAVVVSTGAEGTEIRDLAVTGATQGIAALGSEGVLVDRVWIHDTAAVGLDIEGVLGPTVVSVTRSLVEAATTGGIYLEGAEGTIESTVVRNTRPWPGDQMFGDGIVVMADPDSGARARAKVQRCVVEQNREVGILVIGSDATIESSVVRATQPGAASDELGRGIGIQSDPFTGERGSATITACTIDLNHDVGVVVSNSDAVIEATVVEYTQPELSTDIDGRGIVAQADATTGESADVAIRSCVVRHNRDVGVAVTGGSVVIEATVVRDTQPRASDQRYGLGIGVAGATATLRSCVVERSAASGISIKGSEATIEATIVRDTQAQAYDQAFGRGLDVDADIETGQPASVRVLSCLFDRNREAAVVALSSQLTLEATLVRDTTARTSDGAFGDGVLVWGYAGPASALVTGSRIERSARAGAVSLGSTVSFGRTVFECNPIHLDAEVHAGVLGTITDLGDDSCGCAGTTEKCVVKSAGLSPPDPLP